MSLDCVVDASVAVKWVLAEADSDAALRLRGRTLLAPQLMWVEAANILWKQARRGVLSVPEATLRWQALAAAPVQALPDAPLLAEALRLALALGHPAYDCLYLAAAAATGLPLVTADRALARLPGLPVPVVSLDALP